MTTAGSTLTCLSHSQNRQYKKFRLLLEVSPAMTKLLDSVGPDGAGHEFTKQLHDVVRHVLLSYCNSPLI